MLALKAWSSLFCTNMELAAASSAFFLKASSSVSAVRSLVVTGNVCRTLSPILTSTKRFGMTLSSPDNCLLNCAKAAACDDRETRTHQKITTHFPRKAGNYLPVELSRRPTLRCSRRDKRTPQRGDGSAHQASGRGGSLRG